ncbi:MAG TPA: thrombospondin type 3 repeat-containing protein [Chitinophagaceae bacterium]|nr:thrombospondin type 3 repeat-containing protein [Chitinophagaceae bacterium]
MRNLTFRLCFLVVLSTLRSPLMAQAKLALAGGFHSSYVYEYTSKPAWNSEYRPFYKPRASFHGGLVLDVPMGSQGAWFFQPSLMYSGQGRKFQRDTYYGIDYSLKSTQFIDYLTLPMQFVYKADISNPLHRNRTRFIFGLGPYLAYLLGGTETADTVFSNGTTVHQSGKIVYGSGPGQYGRIDLGLSGQVGLQFGQFFITANINRGLLTSFYRPVGYDATFRNGVIGGTIGLYLGRNREPVLKDQDNDGIPDQADGCPTEPGTALTNGCPDADGDGIPDKTDKCPEVAGSVRNQGCPVADSDGDGVPDDQDKCPNVPGLPIYDGCPFPDRDHDGVSDFDDRCPDSAGLAINKGCPVGDRDKDGVNDMEDKCPDVPGLAKYAGCPVPDSDKDGVNDELDKCPYTPGTAENQGCPTLRRSLVDSVDAIALRLEFNDRKSDVPAPAYRALDDLVRILKAHPTLTVSIESYTMAAGDSSTIQKLTVERANNIMAYVGLQGIDWSRLKATGMGSATPPAQPGVPGRSNAAGDRIRLVLGYQ